MVSNFSSFIRAVSREGTGLLAQFDCPPTFEVWDNPVAAKAREYRFLVPDGGRSSITDYVFEQCNAGCLVDDGSNLVDAGITLDRRLWLIYQYHSLTDFYGDRKHTSVNALLSIIQLDDQSIDLSFCFDWLHNEALSRLNFENDEGQLSRFVFAKCNWRTLHRKICQS